MAFPTRYAAPLLGLLRLRGGRCRSQARGRMRSAAGRRLETSPSRNGVPAEQTTTTGVPGVPPSSVSPCSVCRRASASLRGARHSSRFQSRKRTAEGRRHALVSPVQAKLTLTTRPATRWRKYSSAAGWSLTTRNGCEPCRPLVIDGERPTHGVLSRRSRWSDKPVGMPVGRGCRRRDGRRSVCEADGIGD